MNSPCFSAADILLPPIVETARGLWSTIACDQFTSEPDYWNRAEALVGDAPSTLRLMLPEVWLGEATDRLPAIHRAMQTALDTVLVSHPGSMIAVERTQSDGRVRHGLVGKIDLEQYDYNRGATSLIRATEGTVLERIPPRVAIRRGAPLELPHVMLLIDDPRKTVLEPLFDAPAASRPLAYECDLMLGGGHIRGTYLDPAEQSRVLRALDDLISPAALTERYGSVAADHAPLLFAVGDGNHSLASAKAAYEELKATLGPAAASHPARYALVEVVNLHDDALQFEPIYRVLFGVKPEEVLADLRTYIAKLHGTAQPQKMTCVRAKTTDTPLSVPTPARQLTVGTLQDFLDDYLRAHPGATADYIHDESSLRALTDRPDSIGFLFDGMEKSQLFRTVLCDGALPRKTFSMGHARDKRYYMECRRIR